MEQAAEGGAASARAAALIELAEHRTPTPMRRLYRALQDPDRGVRAAAAFALSKLGSRRSVPHLLRAWQATAERDRHERRQIVLALGELGGARALAATLGSFACWDRALQELALGFLADKGDPDGPALLQGLLAQELSAARRAAVERALRRVGRRRAAATGAPSGWVAVIVYEATSTAPGHEPLLQESFVLLRARSETRARAKALVHAQAESTSYRGETGETITWTLKAIVDVAALPDEPLRDGSELYVRHFRDYAAYRAFEPMLDGRL